MLIQRTHHPAVAVSYAVRFDPATAVAAIASAVVGAVDGARKGAADRNSAEFQARLLEQDAERQKQAGVADATALRRRGSQLSARQRAALAGSGLALSGTPLLVQSDIAADTERQVSRALAGADTTAARKRQEAALQRLRGANRRDTSFFRAGKSLLSGTGGFADLFRGNGPTA